MNMQYTPDNVGCPICHLPAVKMKGISTICTFFRRVQWLKFDDDPEKSARIKSKHFRLFHADICERCHLPLSYCREKKLRAIHSKIKTGKYVENNFQGWASPEMIQKWLAEEKCNVPGRLMSSVPQWWRSTDAVKTHQTTG